VTITNKKYDNDVQLVAACLSSDENAWAELISTYKSICRNLTIELGASHLFNHLFSDFIIKLLGTANGTSGVLCQYNGGVALKTFLSTVFRHMVIDHLRKKKISIITTDKPIEQYADPDPPDGLEYSELETELWLALNSLSIPERKIIELYYYHNLNIRNIAEIIEQSKSKVGRTLKEIRKKLKKKMTE
jgi:RNA polymerase sigma factor (sigma-70 family)